MASSKKPPRLVRDLMSVGVPTCPVSTPLVDLTRLMIEKRWEAVVVLEEEQGHAVGYVSQKELVRAFTLDNWRELVVENIMEPDLPSVPPDIPLLAAVQIMLDQNVRVLFMTHHASGIYYPAAWLTFGHVLRVLAVDDLSDLGIDAARVAPLDVFLQRREAALRMQAASRKE